MSNLSFLSPANFQSLIGYTVTEFDAPRDGVNDDAPAFNRAIAAIAAKGGGTLFVPPGTYYLGQPISITADNIVVQGAGWASQLVPLPSFSAGPMLQVQTPPGGAGTFRYGIRIASLFFNGNSLPGVQAGLDLNCCYGAVVEHVRCRFIPGIAVHWDGVGGQFGAYNYMKHCHISDGVGATAVGVQTDDSEWLTILGGHFGFYQTAGAVAAKIQNLNNRLIGVSFDYVDTAIQLSFTHRNIIQGCQFDRGFTRFVYLQSGHENILSGNFFGVRSGAGTEVIRADGANNGENVAVGNVVEAGSGWPNFVQEIAGLGGVNTYADNDTGGTPLILKTGTARGNHGYNPVGSLAAPAVPASTVAQANTFGVDATVFVAGGTVSAIAIGGVATGATSGSFRLPAGQTITLTYSVAPTWTWYGD